MLNLNTHPLDWLNIHPAIIPVDSQAGANNGVVISLKGYHGALILIEKEPGTAGDDPVVTLTQATAVAGTGEKALPLPANRVRSKLHATTVPGLFTDAANAAAAGGTYTDDTSAEKAGIIAIWIKTDDLDVDNGFDCIRVAIPDTGSGSAQLLTANYVLFSKYGVGGMLSPITD